ncbi:MAG: DUF503 domain-containing protein [Myxococcaceae bacterium]
MFVCVARVTLDIPGAGSLKAKRQVLRRVTDRLKARFNLAIAEVEDNDVWNRAVIGLSVVSNERKHAQEIIDKVLQQIDDLYVAPVHGKEIEIIPFEDLLGASGEGALENFTIPRGERSLAEAEGMGAWEDRHTRQLPPPSPSAPRKAASGQKKKELSLEDARAVARSLRNRREWENKD